MESGQGDLPRNTAARQALMDALRPNAQYNLARAQSLSTRIAGRVRRRMYDKFIAITGIRPEERLLDVGVTSDQTYDHSNYIESWYPYKDHITAVGVDDAAFLEQLYPGMTFRRANGLDLPFADDSFDVVHSSAVLEHVGSAAQQRRFIAELVRVSRRVAFLTTPNRWFPVEFHTQLPLLHWLPKRTFRRLLRRGRYEFFAREENLNLVGAGELRSLCGSVDSRRIAIRSQRLLGLTSNLLLIVEKASPLSARGETRSAH